MTGAGTMGAAGVQVPGDQGSARRGLPAPRRYILTDGESGEDYVVDAATVVGITGIEIAWIDWVITEDGQFENRNWRVR